MQYRGELLVLTLLETLEKHRRIPISRLNLEMWKRGYPKFRVEHALKVLDQRGEIIIEYASIRRRKQN